MPRLKRAPWKADPHFGRPDASWYRHVDRNREKLARIAQRHSTRDVFRRTAYVPPTGWRLFVGRLASTIRHLFRLWSRPY